MSQATVLIRGSLTTMIYSKVMDLDLRVVDDTVASTLMSVDVGRICMVVQEMHQVWANPIELGLAVWLLERQLGVPCVMPVILALGISKLHIRSLPTLLTNNTGCTFGSMMSSGSIGKAQGTWLDAIQKRLRATESLLGSIKSAKMMRLTTRASKFLQELRTHEIKAALGFRNLMVGSLVLCEYSIHGT
jgi:ATP-binding cassette, subfamily C (CFTR/MRP), member 1